MSDINQKQGILHFNIENKNFASSNQIRTFQKYSPMKTKEKNPTSQMLETSQSLLELNQNLMKAMVQTIIPADIIESQTNIAQKVWKTNSQLQQNMLTKDYNWNNHMNHVMECQKEILEDSMKVYNKIWESCTPTQVTNTWNSISNLWKNHLEQVKEVIDQNTVKSN